MIAYLGGLVDWVQDRLFGWIGYMIAYLGGLVDWVHDRLFGWIG